MSTDRHPLDDALAEAEREGATYEVPVELVRVRARRRRRARTAARGGVALAAVGAVALALPLLPGVRDGAPTADDGEAWEAPGDLCGQRYEASSSADSPLDVTLTTTSEIGPDRIARTSTVVEYDRERVREVGSLSYEVVLLRDGVVVAVDGAGPELEHDLDLHLTQVERPPAPPGADAWTTSVYLASCASFPDGPTDVAVPAGSYELAHTEDVDWVAPDGSVHTVRVVERSPVTVTGDGQVPERSPDTCGTDASRLAALAADEDAFPVTLDANVPVTAAAGSNLRITVRATNDGPDPLEGRTGNPRIVLTRDGRVVSEPGALGERLYDATVPPGGSLTYPAWSSLEECVPLGVGRHGGVAVGDALPPGDYQVWLTLRPLFHEPDGTDESFRNEVLLVGGPWPLTLE
ncbi:conserved hypothetical protein [Cellulomonas flavigena DSM 20109]|uniref:Uncharacterized protein n=1 Tax=Cellulomonas flavigena (strain ATCC 482 / DSM 20109 / BCRC 11376 / JCM 18109 / NBRC 3775 / NCIMB 8073 / NRS 134) TaxID=446466 RepID=D5UJL3_CELFN|nr:hypothetical protein [Cellulomonas flavigena]ADG75651.1 conserved hypothetical protein [Cellulomonas flavigena DSM 20109]